MDWSNCSIVEIDPLKVSGTPILKGTRMPADFVLDNFLTGSPVEEIADNFELSLEMVEEILRFALQNALDRAA